MKSWPEVAVVGPGAVGCFFGGMLARAGARVRLLGRPGPQGAHLRAIGERGLVFDGVEVQETIPLEVETEASSLSSAELVLFAVKALDNAAAAARIRPHLRADATVVSLQNGMENVATLASAGVSALPTVVYVAAAIENPGAVKHRGRGDLVIGSEDAARRATAEPVAAWFVAAGVPCPVSGDIRRDQWTKLIINSMANAISALTGASYRRLAEFEPTWELARRVAREAAAVAAAEGTRIDVEAVMAAGRQVAVAVGDATSSTEQDIARGRRTEIDSFNGFIARRGDELGIETPANEALTALVQLRERS